MIAGKELENEPERWRGAIIETVVKMDPHGQGLYGDHARVEANRHQNRWTGNRFFSSYRVRTGVILLRFNRSPLDSMSRMDLGSKLVGEAVSQTQYQRTSDYSDRKAQPRIAAGPAIFQRGYFFAHR